MKFIKIRDGVTVNPRSIDYIRRNNKGFAVIHIGIEELVSNLPFDSFVDLLHMSNEDKFDQFKFA